MTQRELHPIHDRHLVRFDILGDSHGIKRISEHRRAYDCTEDRDLCMHSPSMPHGFRFDEWWYGLKKDNYGFSFGVCPCLATGMGVPQQFQWMVGGPPTALRTTLLMSLVDLEGKPVQPELDEKGVPQNKLMKTLVSRTDNEFCRLYVEPTYEQPLRFWDALETMFEVEMMNYRRRNAS